MPIKKSAPTGSEYASTKPAVDEDEFEDEEEVERERVPAKARSGWDAADEVQKKVKGLGDFFTFDEEPALVVFVEGAPMDSYLVHWVDTKDGRRSFRCMDEEEEEGCPLCDVGDNPSAKFAFWVVEFEIKGEDVTEHSKIMEVGTRLKNTLKDINGDPRKGGPLGGNFYSAHRTGKKQSTQYHIARVKDRDLLEDWGFSPEDGRALVKEIEEKGAPRLYIPNIEDLEVAAAYLKRHG